MSLGTMSARVKTPYEGINYMVTGILSKGYSSRLCSKSFDHGACIGPCFPCSSGPARPERA